ncbi:MAG: hypothetical protein NT062_28850, partial [Proteobacteria bacterium]|nr:hypothetical protein [Pseudomonadota bacterium]
SPDRSLIAAVGDGGKVLAFGEKRARCSFSGGEIAWIDDAQFAAVERPTGRLRVYIYELSGAHRELASIRTKSGSRTSGGRGVLVIGGVLYIAANDGVVRCDLSSGTSEPVWSGGHAHALAHASGKLLVASDRGLFAIDASKTARPLAAGNVVNVAARDHAIAFVREKNRMVTDVVELVEPSA